MSTASVDNLVRDDREFAEPVPEYLRPGYRLLMAGQGTAAIELWEATYNRYPSAEICGHLARAHYYQTFFLNHPVGHPLHAEHIRQMRTWAERAISLNPNSSIGHAMLAGAIGRQALLSGSQKQLILCAWQVRFHAEHAIRIDNHWVGHFVLGSLHRELASINPALRFLARVLQVKLPDGSYSASIEHFQEVLRQYPDNNWMYGELGMTYEAMGDLKSARLMYERCLAMPVFKHPIAHYHTLMAADRLKAIGR